MDRVLQNVHNIQTYYGAGSRRTALIILPGGAEEAEVVITADVLTRAKVEVTIAGIGGPIGQTNEQCSQGIRIVPTMTFDKAADINEQAPYDVIILPGGAHGSETLRRSPAVGNILKRQEQNGGWIAAISGGALSLRSHGIAIGKCLTTHRRIRHDLKDGGLHKVCNLRVCVDGNIITSQGPGTAFEFALTIVEKLVGPDGISDLRDDLALLNWG